MSSKKFFSKVTEPIDQWLESQGLYRKHTAHDPSCLFRAVAEQVFYSQCCHDIVRKQCVNFIAHNKDHFEKMLDVPIDSYLSKLNNAKEWGSQIELNALSLLYEREIIVFEQGEKPTCISINNIFTTSIMLCASSESHYDSVYPKSYIMKAAFCQSLAYEVLYKRVFGLVDVDFAVEKMLHKSTHSKREHYLQQNYLCSTRNVGLPIKTVRHIEPERFEDELNVRDLLSRGITPFPYKVAKALDPDIYRNIEFDVWSDLRREMKLGMLGGNDELQIGVKCLVKMQPDRLFHAHIQEMEPNNGPVIVFVEELGKKCTVSHDVLEPLPKNQKIQWSVPYKQQRHLATLSPKTPFLALSEFSSKWRKNKYNKSRKLKDMFIPSSLPSTHCSPCNTASSFHQDQPNNLHYPLEQFSYNSNTSLASSEECSNTSSQMMQSENVNSRNLMPIPTDSVSSSTSPTSLDPDQIPSSSCSPPLQIIGVPVYHSVCTDSSGARVSTPPSSGSPFPSYIICSSNTQGRIHQMPNNMDNFTFQPVNFYAQKSFHLNGSDLPFSDIPTLRFYYNLGHDYFRSGCLMWPSSNPTCSSHTSVPPSENSPQILPDSTVNSEDDTCQGQKQSISPCLQQPMVQGIPHTASHPVPVTVQALPQGGHVPHMTSGIVSTVLPQMVPVSPTTSQPMTYPQTSHKLISQPPVSPQHTICPIIPQSPPIQPLFGMNNMWPGQQNSVIANPQRINSPENDSRSTANINSEDNGNRGTDAKSPNSCQASIAVHPNVVDSFTSPVYPYYLVEMDSVPYYNPCSYVMQTTSDMDPMSPSHIHSVPSSPLPQMPSVMYHSQPLATSGPVPHWISTDGVSQYTMAM